MPDCKIRPETPPRLARSSYYTYVLDYRLRVTVVLAGIMSIIGMFIALGSTMEHWVASLMFIIFVCCALLSIFVFVGDERAEYALWKEWYFDEPHLSFFDWLDREYITGQAKHGSKRKPPMQSMRQLVGTTDEQTVFDFWYYSEWREEYTRWHYSYTAYLEGKHA